ncbi:hydantoinase B/oxoprolinase family protein [Mycobacterium sp. 3519A]|uniref:hydantoinase B/oxoprolinase family protein n=1 Tax=Mycobacterium sp. 3519A TaxID=2057184 RepID=UPI001359B738|nr:hydantoinase B/oxoprolinase family protein [Mycobacterium sp. 3519A]
MSTVDAIEIEVISQSLVGVVQQMQNSLFRTGYSTIIRESRDASCAILDTAGRVVAQHTVLPLHLGAFPASLEAVLAAYPIDQMRDGDAFIVNHPYFGGSPHASDMAVIAPIMLAGKVFAFSGSIAHKSDIGGLVPGTNSGQAKEIFHEGLLLPPVRYCTAFEPSTEIEAILQANSRTPRLVLGDLRGQVGAARLATERIRGLCAKYGAQTVEAASDGLLTMTERRVRAAVTGWPDGVYTGSRTLHTKGIENGRPVTIRVVVTIDGDSIRFDFRRSDDQVSGPYNIRPPLVRAVCYYALKCLVDPDIPANGGFAAAIDADFRPGSLLSPELPAPVNTYMTVAVATADALFDALGQALPAARIAESSKGTNGTLSHLISRHGQPQVQYELPAGAIGARHDKDGVSASKAHVANGTLTPIEVVESEFPVQLERFELVVDSGGPGRYRGGLGYVRDYRLLGEARFSSRTGKDLTPPAGRAGGLPGGGSAILVNPGRPDEYEVTVDGGPVALRAGDVLRLAQAGGGGYGDPLTRPVEDVLTDVREGYVSAVAARSDYGVALDMVDGDMQVNDVETQRLRFSPTGSRPVPIG